MFPIGGSMMYLMNVTFFVSVNLLFMNNPLIMSYTIVLLSCLLAVQMTVMMNYWFSYLMILVFSGGMMILMIYISSLASNVNSPFMQLNSSNLLVATFIFLTLTILIYSGKNGGELNEKFPHIFFLIDFYVLVWILIFLLFGIFLIVFFVNKKMGALR